jgi:prophage DNA circulation protein
MLSSGFFRGLGLADASGYFRGARFRLDSYQTETGRRADVREYPLRNIPNAEDLGRKARRFSFSGYVLGATWEIERDALLDACEADGPGLLQHPFHGDHMVMCEGCTVRESRADGICYATFELQFVEAGSFNTPSYEQDSGYMLLGQARQARGTVEGAF